MFIKNSQPDRRGLRFEFYLKKPVLGDDNGFFYHILESVFYSVGNIRVFLVLKKRNEEVN